MPAVRKGRELQRLLTVCRNLCLMRLRREE